MSHESPHPMMYLGRLFGLSVYYADKHFDRPGLHVWAGRRMRRVVPMNVGSHELGREELTAWQR